MPASNRREAPELAEPCAYIDEASAELVRAILVLAVLPPQPFFADTASVTVLSPTKTVSPEQLQGNDC